MAEFGPVTCAGCGLLCDDVRVDVAETSVRVQPDCRLAAEWFSERVLRPASAAAAHIRGEPADVESALARAAELLRDARRPLLYGFAGSTVEDARAAVALADRLGALVATDSLDEPWPGAPAVPLRGASTATLGEVRDRSRVVVVWREDPETTHPRLLERIGFGDRPPTRFGGERTLIVVDDRDTPTSARADVQLRWPRERDLEALVTLHTLNRGRPVTPNDVGPELGELLERAGAVPHVTFFYGAGLTAGAGGQRRELALHELVRSMCHERHVVTLALPRAPGTTGARDVLAWQTGYGTNIDLAGGHPELLTTTRPLEHEAVDVAVRIEGALAPLPGAVTEIALGGLPAAENGDGPEVSIRTAAAGVDAAGTAHRLDGVPLTLQAPLAGELPTAAALLTRLLQESEW